MNEAAVQAERPSNPFYTAEQKKKILEEFLLAQASGEPNESIFERLGVSRTSIYYWKAQLEKGRELRDSTPGVPAQPKEKAPVKAPGHGQKRDDISLEQRLAAVEAYLAGEKGSAEIWNHYGIANTSFYSWVKAYKEGKYDAVKRAQKKQQKAASTGLATRAPKAEIVKAPATTQLGMFLDQDEAVKLKMLCAEQAAEIKRLRAKVRRLMTLVVDDE